MKRLLFILLFLPCFSFGQNLVPNPSFEDTVYCPVSLSDWGATTFWYDPTWVTSDYFHQCNTGVAGVPDNIFGSQSARTGKAYGGLSPYMKADIEVREYISAPLLGTLIAGRKYYAEMNVSLAETSNCAVDAMGMYFSNGSVDTATNISLPYTPHISNDSGQILLDSAGWTKISGTFIAAGGENYITIGNFKDGISTVVDPNCINNFTDYGYYYIDDVLLVDSTPIGIDEDIITVEWELTVYPNPTTGQFTVSNRQGAKKVEVYDLFGRLLLRSNEEQVDMSDFAKGLYFVKAGKAVRKLVLQ